MLIINSASELPQLEVGDLKPGEIFAAFDNPAPEYLYMVCQPSGRMAAATTGISVVFLSNGAIYNFARTTKAIRVPGAFVVGAQS